MRHIYASSARHVLGDERRTSNSYLHLPLAQAYPLEPGLWRNLLDDDRAFA